MPQIVEMNGVEFEFPDGMSQDDMKVALDKHHSGTAPSIQPQEQGFAESLSGAPPLVGGPMPASSGSTMGQVSPEDAMALSQQESQAGADALQSLTDPITGASKMTPEIEGMPDISGLPEINQITSGPAWMNFFGTLTATNPEEALKVFQSNFPNTPMRQDAKGNWIVTSKIDGKDYAFQPGLSKNEVNRAVGGGALFAATGGSGGVIPAMIGGLATSTGLETAKAMQGGDFNPVNVAVDTIMPLAGKALKEGGKYLGKKTGLLKEIDQTLPIGAQGLTDEVVTMPSVKPKPEVKEDTLEDLAKTLRTSGRILDKKGKRDLADQAKMDPQLIADAKELGILDDLQPDHLSTSNAFRQIAQAVKSLTGSEMRGQEIKGLRNVGKTLTNTLKKMGADDDLSVVDFQLKTKFENIIDKIKVKESKAFTNLKEKIPSSTEIDSQATRAYLEGRLLEVKKVELLEPIEKMAYEIINDTDVPVTYGMLNEVRRRAGVKMDKIGGQGDSETGIAKMIYGSLAEDILTVADKLGLKKEKMLANAYTVARKGIEDDMISIYGNKLNGTVITPLISGVKQLSEGKLNKMSDLIKATPRSMREKVMATGILTAFGKANKNGDLNFTTFGQVVEGIEKNSRSKNMIATNLPEGGWDSISRMGRISNGVRESTGEFITTGKISEAKEYITKNESLLKSLLAIGAKGVAIEGGSALAGIPTVGLGMMGAITTGVMGARRDVIKHAEKAMLSKEWKEMAKNAATGTMPSDSAIVKFSKMIPIPDPENQLESIIRSALQATTNKEEDK
jgi:hypothetical protein